MRIGSFGELDISVRFIGNSWRCLGRDETQRKGLTTEQLRNLRGIRLRRLTEHITNRFEYEEAAVCMNGGWFGSSDVEYSRCAGHKPRLKANRFLEPLIAVQNADEVARSSLFPSGIEFFPSQQLSFPRSSSLSAFIQSYSDSTTQTSLKDSFSTTTHSVQHHAYVPFQSSPAKKLLDPSSDLVSWLMTAFFSTQESEGPEDGPGRLLRRHQ